MRWVGIGALLASACVDAGAPPSFAAGSSSTTFVVDDTGSTSSAGTSTSGPADRDAGVVAPIVLANDRFATAADTELILGADLGVLANDDGVAIVVVDHDATTQAGGALSIAGDGALVYTPPAGYGGCDRARYVAADADGEAEAQAEAEIVFSVHRGGALGSPHEVTTIADAEQGLGMLAAAAGDRAGGAVTIVGDMDGDAVADIAVASSGASPQDRAAAGRVYVVSGGDARGVVDLEHAGFTIDGDVLGAGVGERLAPAGDVDGDGLADLMLAAPRTSLGGGPQGDHVGRVFVIFGRARASSIDLRDVFAPALGQAFTGEFMGDHAGTSIAAAGDLDDDGTDDLVIGAPLWGPGEDRPGRVYIVFSRAYAGSWRFDQMLASGHAIAIEGSGPDAELGRVVAGVGDLDGDGDREIAIASPMHDGTRGRVWIVDGAAVNGQIGGHIDELVMLGLAHTIDGVAEKDAFGGAIAVVGDVDGDGTGDLAIGAAGTAGGRGRAWILSGAALAAATSASDVATAITIDGANEGEAAGTAVAAAGDIDGDGILDVWIGAGAADAGAGRSYAVMLGEHAAQGGNVALAEVTSGIGGFALVGTGAMGTGRAIAGGVDLDGDAVPDAVIGSPGASERGQYSGRADLVGGAAVLCE